METLSTFSRENRDLLPHIPVGAQHAVPLHNRILNLGLTNYIDVHQYQRKRVAQVIDNPDSEQIIINQHHPVYTCGKATATCDRPVTDIPLVDVERGGKLTYHGPSQLVAYPILHLAKRKLSVTGYLHELESVIITILKELGLEGTRRPEFLAGVWVGEKKICSIGIALKKWVSYHGLAFNINCDLAPFRAISPCGISGDKITSLKEEIGCQVDLDRVTGLLCNSLSERFF